jgi:hypothetical protein
MARPKTKDSRIVHMRMDLRVYKRVSEYAEDKRKSVTMAIEGLLAESLNHNGYPVDEQEQEDP